MMQGLNISSALLLQLLAMQNRTGPTKNAKFLDLPFLTSKPRNSACGFNVYESDTCAAPEASYTGEGLQPGFVGRVHGRSAQTIPTRKRTLEPKTRKKRAKRNSLTCGKWLWPDGVVPYRIATELDPDILNRFLGAVEILEGLSCVRFVPMDTSGGPRFPTPQDRRTLRVIQSIPVPGKRCKATVGLSRPNPFVMLSTVCTPGQVLHELMHVLGFAHEHMRPDRDEYVKIHCENILPNMTTDFRRLLPSVVSNFDQPYDFYSIMHYRLDHFSIDGEQTIQPLDPTGLDLKAIGEMQGLSEGDVLKLNALYSC